MNTCDIAVAGSGLKAKLEGASQIPIANIKLVVRA